MTTKRYYRDQQAWRQLQEFLPERLRLRDDTAPEEDFWDWHGHTIHLDRYRNPAAKAKVVLHHGVGTNGRQMTLILGAPLAKLGFEVVALDNLGYGMTAVKPGTDPDYADWVRMVVDFLAFEKQRDPRPIVLYNPHWQQYRSSWWRWGPEAVRRIVASDRYNLIFAPHQRLIEGAGNVASLCEELATNPNVHCDFTSFATVDGSYTAAADLYLGDTSSQVVEFLIRPRPALFLNAQDTDWRGNPAYDMWRGGEVVTDLDALLAALDHAAAEHPRYLEAQRALAADLLGPLDGHSSERAAAVILAALDGD